MLYTNLDISVLFLTKVLKNPEHPEPSVKTLSKESQKFLSTVNNVLGRRVHSQNTPRTDLLFLHKLFCEREEGNLITSKLCLTIPAEDSPLTSFW